MLACGNLPIGDGTNCSSGSAITPYHFTGRYHDGTDEPVPTESALKSRQQAPLYDAATGRMTSYSHTIGATAYSSTLTWNANGSLAQIQTQGSNSQNCSYTHDDLGRIASVSCGANEPSLNFNFDPFGNIAVTGSPAGLVTTPVYSNNQLTRSGGVTMHSDADGNLLDDPVIPSIGANSFDAEGHAVKFENATVVYDALGRAAEVNGTRQFVYGPDGRKLAVMNGATLKMEPRAGPELLIDPQTYPAAYFGPSESVLWWQQAYGELRASPPARFSAGRSA